MKTICLAALLFSVVCFSAVNFELAEQYRNFEWTVYQASIDGCTINYFQYSS